MEYFICGLLVLVGLLGTAQATIDENKHTNLYIVSMTSAIGSSIILVTVSLTLILCMTISPQYKGEVYEVEKEIVEVHVNGSESQKYERYLLHIRVNDKTYVVEKENGRHITVGDVVEFNDKEIVKE